MEGLAQGHRLVLQPAVDRKCGARHRQHDLIRRRGREIGCHVVIPHDGGTPDRTDDPAIELFIHEAREARQDQPLREAPDLADACQREAWPVVRHPVADADFDQLTEDLSNDKRPVTAQPQGGTYCNHKGRKLLRHPEAELPPELQVAPEIDHANVLEPVEQCPQRQHADDLRDARVLEVSADEWRGREQYNREHHRLDDFECPGGVVMLACRLGVAQQCQVSPGCSERLQDRDRDHRHGDHAEVVRRQADARG